MKKEPEQSKSSEPNNPKVSDRKTISCLRWAAYYFVLALVLAFFAGAFPAAPIVVATGSMAPAIQVGDVVLVWPIDPDKLEEGDIIRYKGDGYTVIHRVVEVNGRDTDDLQLITKGDANNGNDSPVSREQIIGKVILKIPYIGKLVLWLHGLRSDG